MTTTEEPKTCSTCRHWKGAPSSIKDVVVGSCEFPLPAKLPVWVTNFLSSTTLDTDGSKCQAWEARALRTYKPLYGTEDQERLDSSVEAVIATMLALDEPDEITWPVRVLEFRHIDPSNKRETLATSILDDFLSQLDEDYGDRDSSGTEPTPAMRSAALAFVNAVLAEYTPWTCEPTGKVVEVTRERAMEMTK